MIDRINIMAAIQHEKEREEICFIKRAYYIIETMRREGIIGLERCLDRGGIVAVKYYWLILTMKSRRNIFLNLVRRKNERYGLFQKKRHGKAVHQPS